jgi:hypothetical protein
MSVAAAPPDLRWFTPEPLQQDFITYAAKETCYAGGVGSGKTLSGGFKTLWAALTFPGTVGLVGRQTYRALEDTTKKVILYGDDKPPIIPLHGSGQAGLGHYVAKDEKVVLDNGSEILFRSLEDHNIEKLLSLNLGFAYVDELTETTLKIWMTLLGRLRHPVGPRIAWGTTNPNGHDWVWKRFHPDAGISHEQVKIYVAPTTANPHLAPDYVAMLRTMPKEWQKRFVDCSFETAAGMIWDMYSRQVHVFDHEVVGRFPAHWKRMESMDHGRRNPTAWLWWTVDPDGFVIVEDEYYVEGKTPSEHAPVIKSQREMVAENIRWNSVVSPPDCFRASAQGRTVASEYEEAAQIAMTPADDNVDAGLLRVAEWLQPVEGLAYPEWHPYAGTLGPNELGAPRVLISSRCQNLITEIPDYRWQDLSPAAERDKDQPEAPRKKDDHACDAFRYGLMARPRPFKHVVSDQDADRRSRPRDRQAHTAGLIDRTF